MSYVNLFGKFPEYSEAILLQFEIVAKGFSPTGSTRFTSLSKNPRSPGTDCIRIRKMPLYRMVFSLLSTVLFNRVHICAENRPLDSMERRSAGKAGIYEISALLRLELEGTNPRISTTPLGFNWENAGAQQAAAGKFKQGGIADSGNQAMIGSRSGFPRQELRRRFGVRTLKGKAAHHGFVVYGNQ
jgi:hypothetical protein